MRTYTICWSLLYTGEGFLFLKSRERARDDASADVCVDGCDADDLFDDGVAATVALSS